MGKRQSIMVAIPCRRQAHPAMQQSLNAVCATTRHKVEVTWLYSESMICRARSTLVARFMASKHDWLYFWDDDIQTVNTGGEKGNLLDMLVWHGKELVGGLYSTRGLGGHCAVRCIEGEPVDGRLLRVRYLAGGSMMIARELIEDVWGYSRAQLRYMPRSNSGADVQEGVALFQPMIVDAEYLSEDYAFGARAAKGAWAAYADLDVRLLHWGEAPFTVADPRGTTSTTFTAKGGAA